MKATYIVSTHLLAVSCTLLTASCVLSPESSTETRPDEAQSSLDPEPIGQAEQEVVGGRYAPEDFQFVVTVKDDGKDSAGGWQVATNASTFVVRVSGSPTYRWECRPRVQMPLRTETKGPVSPARAAKISADIANDVALPLLSSRS